MARLTDDVRFIRGQLWAIIITIIIVGGGIITTLIALIGAVATDQRPVAKVFQNS